MVNNQHLGKPNAVRVWHGFKSLKYKNKNDEFTKELGQIFIPFTVQLMEPLGLIAYIPSFINSSEKNIPDEIALVFYKDQESYFNVSKKTVAGKAYSMLHENVFNFDGSNGNKKSQSSFPTAFSEIKKINTDHAYHLFDNDINWRNGITAVLVGTLNTIDNIGSFSNALYNEVKNLTKNESNRVNGAILYFGSDYILYWENTISYNSGSHLIEFLKRNISVVHDSNAIALSITGIFSGNDNIILLDSSVSYNAYLKLNTTES